MTSVNRNLTTDLFLELALLDKLALVESEEPYYYDGFQSVDGVKSFTLDKLVMQRLHAA